VKLLLDENVAVQVLAVLRRVLGDRHAVEHVYEIKWGGKKDKFLIPEAADKGFSVLVTQDSRQLADPNECRILKKSRIHHVRFEQPKGLRGLARAMGALVAALPDVVDELDAVKSQRLVRIVGLADRKRHEMIDPSVNPPSAYW
jgi:hypothetical protein